MTLYIILAIFLLLLFLFFCAYRTYKNFVRGHVLSSTDFDKLDKWNRFLHPYGFRYTPQGDYFYSILNGWQRKYGYCWLYDEAAPSMCIIVDCEPIYFTYRGRRWLIELWKGQYGLCTGGEVGIYVADQEDVEIPGLFHGPFFESISDAEMLPIQMQLCQRGEIIAQRGGRHWWLTQFLLGHYCKPEDLSLKASITFPNEEMCEAFIGGLQTAGYHSNEISRKHTTVTVNFTAPKTKQPASRTSLLSWFILRHNRRYCRKYARLTKGYPNTLDKLEYLGTMYFPIFQLFIKPFAAKEQQQHYQHIHTHLQTQRHNP